MNLQSGTWADIIKGEIKMENKEVSEEVEVSEGLQISDDEDEISEEEDDENYF